MVADVCRTYPGPGQLAAGGAGYLPRVRSTFALFLPARVLPPFAGLWHQQKVVADRYFRYCGIELQVNLAIKALANQDAAVLGKTTPILQSILGDPVDD